jgi:hypothetical protein
MVPVVVKVQFAVLSVMVTVNVLVDLLGLGSLENELLVIELLLNGLFTM